MEKREWEGRGGEGRGGMEEVRVGRAFMRSGYLRTL